MPQILTQTDARGARDLPFCYLCGGSIDTRRDRHPDHVPPKAIFAECDRDFPLKVAAHRGCNNRHSVNDRALGQLIAVIHGKYPADGQYGIEFKVFEVDGINDPFLGITNTNIVGQIGRWIRGFHAALYREFLPYDTRSAIHPPFPHGKLQEDGFSINRVLDQQYLFVEILKKNRVAGQIDRIVCNNRKTKYECVWVRMDDGKWACVYALQIYDWTNLADNVHFPKRGCVGWYQPIAGRPKLGAIGTEVEFTISNVDPLDAFGT